MKRFLAMLLAVMMIVSLLPMAAFADGNIATVSIKDSGTAIENGEGEFASLNEAIKFVYLNRTVSFFSNYVGTVTILGDVTETADPVSDHTIVFNTLFTANDNVTVDFNGTVSIKTGMGLSGNPIITIGDKVEMKGLNRLYAFWGPIDVYGKVEAENIQTDTGYALNIYPGASVKAASVSNSGTINAYLPENADADSYTIIDYTGSGTMTLDSYGTVSLNNDGYELVVVNNDLVAKKPGEPAAANVCKIGTTEYANFADALAAWDAGETLTLLANVSSTSVKVLSSGSYTLELGDYTWTANGCDAIKLNGSAGLTINAGENGGITAANSSYDCITADSSGLLYIKGGVYTGDIYVSNGYTMVYPGVKTKELIRSLHDKDVYFEDIAAIVYDGEYYNYVKAAPTAWEAKVNAAGVFTRTDDYMGAGPTWQSLDKYDYYGKAVVYFTEADDALKLYTDLPGDAQTAGTKKYYADNDMTFLADNCTITLNSGVTTAVGLTINGGHTVTVDASASGAAYTGNVVLKDVAAKFVEKYGANTEYADTNVSTTVSGKIVEINKATANQKTFTIGDYYACALMVEGSAYKPVSGDAATAAYDNGTLLIKTTTGQFTINGKDPSVYYSNPSGGQSPYSPTPDMKLPEYINAKDTEKYYPIGSSNKVLPAMGGSYTGATIYSAIKNGSYAQPVFYVEGDPAPEQKNYQTFDAAYALAKNTEKPIILLDNLAPTVALAAGDSFTVDPNGFTFTDTGVTAAAGCNVVKTANDDGTVTYSTAAVTYVAQIGDDKYETLAEAIAAVPADGTETTITMIDNETIEGNAGVTIPATKNIILDLNGFTISNAVNESKNSQVITNNGTLTITDNSENGSGMITNAIGDNVAVGEWWVDPKNNYTTNVISNYGDLTVEKGELYNTAVGSICYCIDNNSNGVEANLTINGGYIHRDNGSAIRMFCNSSTKDNNVTVNGGVIDAGASVGTGIWVQLPGSDESVRPAKLTVTGGTITGDCAIYDFSYGNAYNEVYYDISGGTFNGDIQTLGGNMDISGGTFNGEVDIYPGYTSSYDKVNAYEPTINITGGTFIEDVYIYDYTGNADVSISDGKFGGASYGVYAIYAETDGWEWLPCISGGVYADYSYWSYSIKNPPYVAMNNCDDTTFNEGYYYTVGLPLVQYFFSDDEGRYSLYFDDLQHAIDYAFAYQESGYTDNVIKLLDDIDYGVLDTKTTGATVNAGQSVTLDLNGFMISGTKTDKDKNVYVIKNLGDLTVVDNSEDQDGKILLDQDTTVWNYSTDGVAIENHGRLTVNSGTIEATRTSTGMIYAIDNRVAWEGAVPSLTVNGGTIKSDYAAIRAYAQNTNGTNAIETVVNGGRIISDWAFFLQDGANSTNALDVKVNGGTFDSGKDMFFLGLCSENVAKITISEAEGKDIVSNNTRSVFTYDYDGAKNKVEITIDSGKFTCPANMIVRQVNVPSGETRDPGMAISGGFYSYEPEAALIAEGYAAIENDGSTGVDKTTYPWTIGVAPSPDPVETKKADDFTATKPEEVTNEDVNTEVEKILNNENVGTDSSNIQTVTASVVDKDSQLKIELKALALDVQTIEAATTITSNSAKFDVWPVFIVNGTETLITNTELANLLGDNGYVSFRLAVPDSMVGENMTVMVSHYPTVNEEAHTTDATPDWTRAYPVKGDVGGYYVEIQAREFSIYELKSAKEAEFVAENEQTGVRYTTLEAALEDAVSGQTVFLLKNIGGDGANCAPAEKYVIVENGITLDLKGFNIVGARLIYVTGTLIDTATVKGTISATAYMFTCGDAYTTTAREYVPIYNGTGYSMYKLFFSGNNTGYEKDNKLVYYALGGNDESRTAAQEILANGRFKSVIVLKWNNGTNDVEKTFTMTQDYMNDYFTKLVAKEFPQFTAVITGNTTKATVESRFVSYDEFGNVLYYIVGPSYELEADTVN